MSVAAPSTFLLHRQVSGNSCYTCSCITAPPLCLHSVNRDQSSSDTTYKTTRRHLVNDQQNASRSQEILLMYSKFTPTCFGKWLPPSGCRRCLRSYSSSACIVGVYRLRSVQCGQFSWNVKIYGVIIQKTTLIIFTGESTSICTRLEFPEKAPYSIIQCTITHNPARY
jgi:hypothetical protein